MELVGRVAEVVALDGLRASAARGAGAIALLTGEPGIGKTTVVAEAVGRARAAGFTVLAGRAEPDEGAPAFWPWLSLLSALSPALLSFAAASPASFAEGESVATARFRAIREVLAALAAAAARAPLVLVLEDLHWADPASLDLLAALGREIGGHRILVLATSRSDTPVVPEATVLPLRSWDVASVGDYLAGFGPAHGTWAAVVHRLGGGNPLWTRELARLLVREGRLARPAGEIDLPSGLRRLVARRTDPLGADCREMLGVAAACGADLDVLALGFDPELVAAAVAAGVLVDDPWVPARLRFGHELMRQALYADLDRPARIRAHGRIADALTAAGASSAAIARHRVRAAADPGSRSAAVAACAAAARDATAALDHGEAVHWLTRALENAPDDPALRLDRAGAAYRDGQLDVAVGDCAAIVDRVGAPAALVVRGFGGLDGTIGPALLRICERALALDLDEAGRAQVLAQYAFLIAEAHDAARAEPVSRQAMELAERSGHPGALVAAIHARYGLLDPVLDVAEVTSLAGRAATLAGPGGRPDAELWSHTWRLDSWLLTGDLAAYDAELARLAELVDRLGWPVARWHLLRARAVRSQLAGRFAEAVATAVEARDLDPSAAMLLHSFRTSMAPLTGEPPPPPDDLIAMNRRFPGVPIGVAQLGRVAVVLGDRDLAAEQAGQLRAIVPRLAVDARRPYVVVTAGLVAAFAGDEALTAECYRLSLPYAGSWFNTMSGGHGAADRMLGVMAAAIGADRAGEHLAAAVAMEERLGSAPFLALAQVTHARHLRDRDPRRARTLAGAALATARRLGMTPVAAEAAALAGDTLLTAREREIAALVADGLSNRAIAGRLVLSERTVETHVRSILHKLGVRGRHEIRAGTQWQH